MARIRMVEKLFFTFFSLCVCVTHRNMVYLQHLAMQHITVALIYILGTPLSSVTA